MQNSRNVIFFRIGKWSNTNQSILNTLRLAFPNLIFIEIDLLAVLFKNKIKLTWAIFKDLTFWRMDLLQRNFSMQGLIYGPAVSDLINRLAVALVDELEPLFTFQTSTRFNASSNYCPHYTLTDITERSKVIYKWIDLTSKASRAVDRLQDKLFINSRVVFAMADYLKRSLINDYALNEEKCVVLPSGPNFEIDACRNIDKAKLVILFVGINWVYKGGEYLVEAFLKIADSFPNAELQIVGSAPSVTHPRIKVFGIRPKIEMAKFFSQADLFCLPTLREGFGMVFVEAMHYGLPVIGTNIAAIPEMIQDGKNGFLVPPRDANVLAEKLGLLLADESLRSKFGQESLNLAKTKWNWKVAEEVLLDVITKTANVKLD